MPTVSGRTGDVLRGAALVLLGGLAAVAVWFLFATPTGRAARDDPRHAAANVRGIVQYYPVGSASALVGAYLTLAILCLPVWWLQIFAGVAFGLWTGGGLCLAASAASAAVTAALADWFAGDWFHARIESKRDRLRWLDETLGHNGLLVVMAVRLTHVVPFGLSNVALGLSRVSTRDVLLGTLLGNVPAVAVYVGLGAGYHPLTNWRFDSTVGLINVTLLVPLALRYAKPGWFSRIGIE
jgi:uncharacterized membrane protein YdjX (TVP38/TMEM64 family)